MLADPGFRARIKTPVSASGSPTSVIAALSARKALRSGVLWGYIFGIAIASSEISYVKLYKTSAQREALAATYGTSKAVSALFGPAPQLQTVSGFSVFKISMTLMILGAIWGLLTSSRLLRGEEDAGRWDLLLCGQTTRRWATAQTMIGLGAGLLILWVITAIITIVSGLQASVGIGAGSSIYFALAMVTAAAMFLGVGAVTSQLAATRHRATLFAVAFLGVSYGLRFIADAGVGLHGLIWISPLGWVEELKPLTSPQPLALVPIIAFTAMLAIVAIHLAGTRDAGTSIVADRANSPAHLRLLSGPTGLSIRLMRGTVIGWWVGIGLSAFIYGTIVESAGTSITGSVKDVFSKLGVTGTGSEAILGVCFLIEAILVGFVAAGQVTAAREEETEGTIDHFMAQPVSRADWLRGRCIVALIVLALSGVMAGVLAWLGTASQHTGLGFVALLGAGVNLVPPAIVVLGIGMLTFGIRPRATSIVVYTVLYWSLLLVIVGGFSNVNHWVLDTSVFHHIASAPGIQPNWGANGIMIVLGVAATLIGGLAFRHRDLQGA